MEKTIPQNVPDNKYHSKEIVSNACSEIFENILRKTYEEENPFKSECKDLVDKVSIGNCIMCRFNIDCIRFHYHHLSMFIPKIHLHVLNAKTLRTTSS